MAASAPTLSMRKRAMMVGLLLIFGLGLGALMLEVTVRLFFPATDFLWQWDPQIGMKLIPGKTGRSVKKGLFDVPVEVNSAGFRDRYHEVEKPAGIRRLALLGDSFVEAIQVPFSESITAQLEQHMQTFLDGAECVNLGVSGAGTARHFLALREYGLAYKPDVVLVFLFGNDISDNSPELHGRTSVPYPVVSADAKLRTDEHGQPLFTHFGNSSSDSGITHVIKENWKTYRFLREMIDNSPAISGLLAHFGLMEVPATTTQQGSDNFGFYEIYRTQPKPVWDQAWKVTEQLLLATRDLAEANGASFSVVLIPAAEQVYPEVWNGILARTPSMRNAELDLDEPAKRLSTFLTAREVNVIDLLPEFRARSTSLPPLYILGDGHWTAEGHRLAAEVVSKRLAVTLETSDASLPSPGNRP